MNNNRIRIFILALSLILLISSCSKNGSGYGSSTGTTNNNNNNGTNAVAISGMAFSPSSITIKAGTTVTWTNNDNISHTVTSDTNLFDSGTMGSGATFSYKFMTAGTYNYHCTFHAGMTGKVVVN